MSTSRTPRRLLALALATSLHASALTALADETSVATLAQARAQADQLMAQGQFVRAQATLMSALSDATGSSDERAETLVALRNIRQKISGADRLEIALQQADLAIAEGNLAFAASRVASVLEAAEAGSALFTRATEAQAQIERRQAALRPLVADALSQAAADLDAGRYAQAKSQLAVVRRAGLELDRKQGEKLSRMELRVADAERSAGTTFDASAAAAAGVQAGVVRGRQDGQPAAGGQQGDPQELFREAIQQEARANLSQANAAFEAGELAEARRLYVLVRANQDLLTPEERELVATRIDEIDVRLSGRPSGQEGLGGTRDLVRQNALAEFRVGVNEVERQLAQGNLGAARAQLSRTRVDFQRNRDVFAQPEFEARISELNDLQARIESAAIQIQEDRAQELDEAARSAQEQRAAQQRNERERTINLLLDQAREYQMNMRYREALDTIEQLLLIDPINPSGLLLKNAYENILIYVDYNQIRKTRDKNFAQFRIEAERALIPPLDVVNYPENWPAISQSREAQAEFVDSAENRRVLAQLESSRVQMNLQDNPLESALAYIAQQAEVDMDVEWETLERLGIDRQTPVTLRLASTVNATTALDRLLAKASPDDFNAADWAVIDGLLTISSAETLLDKTAVGIYDINDLLHEIPDYPDVPEIDLQQALQSSQGGGGQSPFQDQGDNEIEETPLEDRINEIIEIVENNIDEDRGFLEGRWTITPYRGLLIIRATPKAHRQIGGLLDKLRAQQALQLNVETRFLLVNQDYFEQIGFDLDIYFNAKADQFQTAAANDPSLLPSDFFDFSGPNGRRRTVVGGGNQGQQVTQPVAAPTNTSIIGAGQNSLGLAGALAPSEGLANTILGAAPALGVAGQFLDDVQVDFLVRATQADRRSTQLTAPRLTLTNGQLANIYVATQVAYVGDLEPVVSDSAVGFDPTVEVATEGVTLLVRGTISSDRRYVTMNVDAGLAQIDGFATEQVTAVAGGTLVSSADTQSFIQLPTVTVTRVRTTVTVPDEGTLLLGGQRLVSEFEVETGVPLLSKLPVLNRFFTNRIQSKEEQTLLILMKPTVLIQSEQEARNFPAMGGGLNPF
ncbi:hypothetical protein AY599_28135 [Leptolyngbya valderiana BDU 20041]|nr:hypothetical protein AY599_28135 [Leptolyngbya valderiana BDU 20041]